MSQSASTIPESSTTSAPSPLILELLPDQTSPGHRCSTRIQQQLDLLLLAIEAIELGSSEAMLRTARELELTSIIKNRLSLWRLRCTNPWRRSFNREVLSIPAAKTLTLLLCYRAKNLTVIIRQLLQAEQEMRDKGFPLENHFRLSIYLERFRVHFRSRMNPRRTKVALYLANEDDLNELAIALLHQLLFCTGTAGMQRLWISLFDGEVG